MPKRKKSVTLTETVKLFDMFGLPVTLNFAGKEKIGTGIGAMITAVVLFFFTLYALRMGEIFVYHHNPNVTKSVE